MTAHSTENNVFNDAQSVEAQAGQAAHDGDATPRSAAEDGAEPGWARSKASEDDVEHDDPAIASAAEQYWRLWVANWTPPFEADAPWSGTPAAAERSEETPS